MKHTIISSVYHQCLEWMHTHKHTETQNNYTFVLMTCFDIALCLSSLYIFLPAFTVAAL